MGVANIEPVYIEQSGINTRIENLVSEFSYQSEGGFKANLENLARNVTGTVEGARGIPAEWRAYFFRLINSVDSRLGIAADIEQVNPARDFLVVRSFIKTFHLQWFVLGEERRT